MDKGSDGGERPLSRVLSHRAGEVPEETPTGEAPSSLPVTPARQGGEEHGVAWGPVIAGLLAGLFVAVMGNLDGLVQLVEGAWKDVVRGEAFPAFDFWRSSRMLPNLEDVTPSALTFWLPEKIWPGHRLPHHRVSVLQLPFCGPPRPHDSDSICHACHRACPQPTGRDRSSGWQAVARGHYRRPCGRRRGPLGNQ